MTSVYSGWRHKEEKKYSPFFYCDDARKYRILSKIGQGAYGEVHKARLRDDRKKFVALKKIMLDNRKEGFPITALREIVLLQLLHHENIVNLIEVVRTDVPTRYRTLSTFYMVFDFCDHDLAGLLSDPDVEFSVGEKKMIMLQLLKGLHYMHREGVMHRDLKSANVLLTKEGVVKIADFGLSRREVADEVLEKCYTTGVVTLWYRAPEILLGQRSYGPPVDTWAAGCIMGELWMKTGIMRGDSELRQLLLICQMCGSITPEVWPGVEQLEFYAKMKMPTTYTRQVKSLLGIFIQDAAAVDLIDGFLVLDPDRRYDTAKALDHEFFRAKPAPCDLRHVMSKLDHSKLSYLEDKKRKEKYDEAVKEYYAELNANYEKRKRMERLERKNREAV